MSQFITLQSGLRVNTAHIIHYGQSEHEGQIKIVLTDEPTPWLETMTAEQLDNLLHGPAIVDPVINLDKLKPGAACCFSGADGNIQHGFIEHFGVDHATPYVSGTSHGDRFVKDLKN